MSLVPRIVVGVYWGRALSVFLDLLRVDLSRILYSGFPIPIMGEGLVTEDIVEVTTVTCRS